MKVTIKKVSGYWVDATVVYSLLMELHKEAVAKRNGIKLVLSPEKDKLDGVLFALKGVMDFLQNKVIYGTLRSRQ